jgi:hypothetical protein
VIVLTVFVVLLVYGIVHLKQGQEPANPPSASSGFAVVDASSACRAWSVIGPVVAQAVRDDDRNALFHLEATGGPGREYQPLMRWAELAYARQQSVILASDLTIVQTRISSAANGSEPLSDLPVPATEVDDQCQAPPAASGGTSSV